MKNNFVPIALALLVLSGCSLAPPLALPDVPTAQAYKEAAPWMPAAPADAVPRGPWWNGYGDDQLDKLQQQLIANSPDLAAALAHYRQAQAYSAELHSGLFPDLALSAGAQRNRQSDTKPPTGSGVPRYYDSYSAGIGIDYEIDLWGRVRNTVDAGEMSAQAAAADLASARLSLQAQLADDFIALRGLDRAAALLDDTVQAYDKALSLTQTRHNGGISSGLDVSRAQAQLDGARAQAAQNRGQRALIEHAIAALVGESASTFSLPAQTGALILPDVPTDVPSVLLQRRPDIAAAQRRVEAANAGIGIARSAFFPSIHLGASYGFQSTDSGGWLSAPNAAWSIGPSLLFDLFDAGKRKARVEQARAVLDANGAQYRGVVLTAFQQVEDNLALLHHYRDAEEAQRSAAAAAQHALDLATGRYREGAVSYLDVVQAQTTALQAQRDELDFQTRRLRASVALIRALGGGWEAEGDLARNGVN